MTLRPDGRRTRPQRRGDVTGLPSGCRAQLSVLVIASVAPTFAASGPGDRDYHGGKWAVHEASFNVAPHTLTSEEAVLAAQQAGVPTAPVASPSPKSLVW